MSNWMPAEHLRIMAFARSLASINGKDQKDEQKITNIQDALLIANTENEKYEPPADQTIRNWWDGKDRPQAKTVKIIKQKFPNCTDLLKPQIHTSPMLRFLCALDIFGSPIESITRGLELKSAEITVGKCIEELSERWAPTPITDGKHSTNGYYIPRLKCLVPRVIPANIYQDSNKLSLIDFMVNIGAFIEMKEEETTEWAIDLASMNLLSKAYLEGVPIIERLKPDYNVKYLSLPYSIFFLNEGDWSNSAFVPQKLLGFIEFEKSDFYPQRLIQAREILRKELLLIGSDLSIAEELWSNVENKNMMWKNPFINETLPPNFKLRKSRKIPPASPGRYRYAFRILSDDKLEVICHDMENNSQIPLPARPDLYDNYRGEFGYGYSGSGAKFLSVSILAHHFGHDNFGLDEYIPLVEKHISFISESGLEIINYLTTDEIDKCINQ